jgi:molybdopterin-biosynthesis enzyme MoeA-like protein
LAELARDLDQVLDLEVDTPYPFIPQTTLPNVLNVTLDESQQSKLLQSKKAKDSKQPVMKGQGALNAQIAQQMKEIEKKQKDFSVELMRSAGRIERGEVNKLSHYHRMKQYEEIRRRQRSQGSY